MTKISTNSATLLLGSDSTTVGFVYAISNTCILITVLKIQLSSLNLYKVLDRMC